MRKLFLFFVFLFFVTLSFSLYGPAQDLPHILLTNDDGIDAPGLSAMYKALRRAGKVTVAAPVTNQSGTSHGLTTGRNPIFVTTWTDDQGSVWHAITARPATCVSLALESLLSETPDIVVSGGNYGVNLGLVTYYSGTVGAAREAAFKGIPSIAVSIQAGSQMDFDGAAEFTAHLVERYLKEKLPPKTFINVNYPALPKDKVKGVKIGSLSLEVSRSLYVKGKMPNGQGYFWPTYQPIIRAEPNTDLSAVLQGYIAITPLQLDTTDNALIPLLKSWQLRGVRP
ncbi:5'/3'-nucleotidase SurE [Acidobacteria bacterium AH-259-L09]|nr:5'/3'-nucleotidase SurE [Acidobacteria bacterium AH-259-L09]